MKLTLVQSIGMVILAALAVAWAEVYLPLRESAGLDLIRLAARLGRTRSAISTLRADMPRLTTENERLAATVAELADKFASAFSGDLYVAINSETNRLFLRRGREVIHEAVISTGSRDTLKQGARRWVFDTPRGVMTVWRKKVKPVWIKPDWAFLEAGESIPSLDSPLRRQEGVLGDYLFDLGGGVGIHGTQAVSLLGQSVTHGCIRVGRDDLKLLFDSVPVGTKVYIY